MLLRKVNVPPSAVTLLICVLNVLLSWMKVRAKKLVDATRRDPDATIDLVVAGTNVPLGADDFVVSVEDTAGVFGAYQRGVYVGIDATITPALRACVIVFCSF